RRGGRGGEPDGLALHRPRLWAAAHLPDAERAALDALRAAGAAAAADPVAQAGPEDRLDRWRADGAHAGGAGSVALRGRRLPQSVGPLAPGRDPPQQGPRPALAARPRPPRPPPPPPPPRPPHPPHHHHPHP